VDERDGALTPAAPTPAAPTPASADGPAPAGGDGTVPAGAAAPGSVPPNEAAALAPGAPADGDGYAPTSTTAPGPGTSLDERDLRAVLGLVFDLGRPWSQKAPFIEGADSLAVPYQQLVAATTAFGTVELRVADVSVQGDQAPFTFDAYLNGVLVRPAIPGTAERVGPAWRLTRPSVCGALAVAAIACPG
jgi:hypothetical protein